MKSVNILIPTLNVGGGEKAAIKNASLFCDMGYDVTIVVFLERVILEVPPNIKVKKITSLKKFIEFCASIHHRNDIINISMLERANAINILLFLFLKSNSVLSIHTAPKVGFNNRAVYKRFFITFFYKLSSILSIPIISVSNGIAHDLNELYGIKNSFVIPNFIPERQLARDIQKDNDNVRFLFLGRLEKIKGIDVLVNSIQKLDELDCQCTITFVGNGSQMRFLSKSLDNIKNININIVGEVDDPSPYLSESNYLLSTSYAEGFGLVILEALSFGCDVVYSKCDFGPREILSYDVNNNISVGFLDPSIDFDRSSDELTNIMRLLVKNKNSTSDKCKEVIRSDILSLYSKEEVKSKYNLFFKHVGF
ncbi:glycosyltransferase [Aliivibrio fischeri]|uniref:glycosyltransferase n=1 Tax=Aliivibrio fischeri TaxID=668 RepID=UPI0012DAD626|nr:glycosyltransferase [Aliivibrio fischeri]MUK67961.1 glycosyltransferase [Aliivibrio fischeri]MUK72908.1 glycosyltransferase [Aliivibrio fischeri]